MEACASLSDFLKAPLGRYVAGPTWLYFYPRVGLCGFAVWGRVTGDDMDRLSRVLKLELTEPPHVSLVDVHRVESVEDSAFATLAQYVSDHHDALARVVTQLALVRPPGLVGAVTAGFFGVQSPPYSVEVFEERARALAWLQVEDPFGAALDRAIAEVTGAPALLSQLRAWIGAHLLDPEIDGAAQALGTSSRSLQRKLREHATTFQSEVNLARIRAAERMLLDTDAQLTRIALDVGCDSLPTFSALFRKLTGEPPSAWRARMRGR